jgi:hypothetical protein
VKSLREWISGPIAVTLLLSLVTGCQSHSTPKTANQSATAGGAAAAGKKDAATSAAPPIVSTTPQKAAPSAPFRDVRIKAGGEGFKDAAGHVWLADAGFEGGQTIERPDIQIANTQEPQIYRSERYLMDSFSWPVPNGNYVVKLHFAETFDGIGGPGQRVFSFDVQGHEFKDFDVWQKAGGPLRAYIESVPVTVTNGVLKISFTQSVENPQINGIEILRPAEAASARP